jgi:siroheme synthase-like protein
MKYFPIYIDLKDKNILIIGTGHEAEPKVIQLLQAGAQTKLISDSRPAYIKNFEEYKNFKFEQRKFLDSDLNNIWLVISTLGNKDGITNEHIYNYATSKNILCNVVDVTELCSFIFPAVVSQGDVNIAISTSGTSPALAQDIRRKISNLIGPEYGLLADILGKIRSEIIQNIPDKKERSKLFHNLVNSGALELLRQNRKSDAEILISHIVEDKFNEIKITGTNYLDKE